MLRCETATVHDAVEEAFDVFDLRRIDGIEPVLRAHFRALSRLLPSLEGHPEFHDEVARLRELARESHRSISNLALGDDLMPVRLHPLAVAYVVLGSRLGARVISARLDQADEQYDAAAKEYFTDDRSRPFWKALLGELQHQRASTQAIVDDARAAFQVFLQEAIAARTTMQDAA